MKAITKTVYCCDYCNKKSLKSLITHEKYCIVNPNHICFTEEEKIKNDRLIQSYLTAMSAINLASFLLVSIQNETKEIKDFKHFNKELDEIWEKLDKNLEFWTGKKRFEYDIKYIINVESKEEVS